MIGNYVSNEWAYLYYKFSQFVHRIHPLAWKGGGGLKINHGFEGWVKGGDLLSGGPFFFVGASTFLCKHIWDKVCKSGLIKFFKGCLPQRLSSILTCTWDILTCKTYYK